MIDTVYNSLIYVGSIVGLISFIACLVSGRDLEMNVGNGLSKIPPTKRRIKRILYALGAIICLSSCVIYTLVAVGIAPLSIAVSLFRPIHVAAIGVIGGLAIINSS